MFARLAGGIDLMIDFATLGEYGLEPVDAFDAGCEAPGPLTGWEGFTAARRGRCEPTGSTAVTAAV